MHAVRKKRQLEIWWAPQVTWLLEIAGKYASEGLIF